MSHTPTGQTHSQQGGNPNVGADCTEMHFRMLLQAPCQLAKALALPSPDEAGRPLAMGHPSHASRNLHNPASRKTAEGLLLCEQTHASKFPLQAPSLPHAPPPWAAFLEEAWAAAVSYFSVVDDLNFFLALRGRQ